MGDKILYIIIFAWVKVHSWLPMPVLYVLSDILYIIIYYVARYRRKVVRNNMKNSFPDKTEKEIIHLERRFYHYFSDYIIETIKLASISEEELLRRAHIRNTNVIFDLIDKGHTCFIFSMGHYGNLDLFTGVSAHFEGRAIIHSLYRPLKNKAFDRLILYLRTRFRSFGIKKNDILREMINLKRNKTHAVISFAADQSPSRANLHYWTTFLNQESSIYTGPERIAKKLDIPVVYGDMRIQKRGFYTVDVSLITDNPKETPEFYITDKYTELMEKTIMRDPAYWLWTHKRWKYKRQEAIDKNTKNEE